MTQGPEPNTPIPADASRPPVVLQVVPSLVTGGVERGTVDIAAALVEAGWTALVASAGGSMTNELARVGAAHLTLPLDSKNPFVMRRNIDLLSERIATHGVDLVHARSRAPAHSARAAARRTGTPFVTTFHGTYNIGLPPKRWYNAVMTKGDRVIAISEFIRRHMTREYGTDDARIRVVHRGIDFRRFDPAAVSAERVIALSRQWRLADGVPIIMLPGRLTRWKGQRVLIEALARLGHDRARCLLVGSDQGRTGYRRELEGLIRARGLESSVHIVGDCQDMPAAYMLADVVVSASTDPEAFGRVIVEGQAMGRPVVAADHGASRELLVVGETGWVVAPGDPQALAARLAQALTLDGERRREFSEKAIANARARFDNARMCAATLDVYREVLDGT
jgi:glycosyltransferase involved in cell wall biosynthesis